MPVAAASNRHFGAPHNYFFYNFAADGEAQTAFFPAVYCHGPLLKPATNLTAQMIPVLRDFPDFTPCFQHAILDALPALFLLLALPIVFLQTRRSSDEERRKEKLPFGALAFARSGLSILLIALTTLLLAHSLHEWFWLKHDGVALVNFVAPILQILTFLVLLVASEAYRRAGHVAPSIPCLAWLLFGVCGEPEFARSIMLSTNLKTEGQFEMICHLVGLCWFLLCLIQILLHLFFSEDPGGRIMNKTSKSRASVASSVFYLWIIPLIIRGFFHKLKVDDVGNLDASFCAQQMHSMEKRLQKKKTTQRNGPSSFVNIEQIESFDERVDDQVPLILNGTTSQTHGLFRLKKDDYSLILLLWNMFNVEFLAGSFAKLISDLLGLTAPLVLTEIITFTQKPDQPMSYGLLLAGMLFIVVQLRSLLAVKHTQIMNDLSLKIQAFLTIAVFEKNLKLSRTSRGIHSSGKGVSLISVDIPSFQRIMPLLSIYWSCPLQIAVILYMLYKTVGVAFLGGAVMIFVFIVPNFVISKLSKKVNDEQKTCTDARMTQNNELFSNIRVLNMYAWVEGFAHGILKTRNEEVSWIRHAFLLRFVADMTNMASPLLLLVITFTMHQWINDGFSRSVITPQIAFVTLTLFSMIRIPMISLGELITQTVQVRVGIKRLQAFFAADEVGDDESSADGTDDGVTNSTNEVISVQDGCFAFHLRDEQQPLEFSLSVKRGQLVGIVGQTGSGKTSMLMALLGELHKVNGFVRVRGRVAYCSQESWILQRSVEENIVLPLASNNEDSSFSFSQPEVDLFFDRVVDACALGSDIRGLSHGIRTEIGEKGANLSGGQKSRISLARAVYHQAEVYLLDDPLSAVDQVVGRHLFEHAIGPRSLTKDATRLLVTHHKKYLHECDWIVVFENNQILDQGPYAVLRSKPEIRKYIVESENDEKRNENGVEKDMPCCSKALTPDRNEARKRPPVRISAKEITADEGVVTKEPTETNDSANTIADEKMIREETSKTGGVSAKVYAQYISVMGKHLFFGFIGFLIANSALSVGSQFWLLSWSNDIFAKLPVSVSTRMSMYAVLCVGSALALGVSLICLIYGSVRASLGLHEPLLKRIIHAPVSFFDKTPLGRILNRFGKEFEIVDLQLASSFRMLAIFVMICLQVFAVMIIANKWTLLLIVAVTVVYVFILQFFIATGRQLQRLVAVTRSPLFIRFIEVTQGYASIRAYGLSQQFTDEFTRLLQKHLAIQYHLFAASRWLDIFLSLLGNLMILAAAVICVLSRDWGTTAGVVGLIVSRSLDLTFALTMVVRQLNEFYNNIVSVERICEYSTCPQEADWVDGVSSLQSLPKDWPNKGVVSFRNLCCRYAPNLPLALNNISVEFNAGERVAVVGRTGAGKSSLTLVLLRIIEPAEGQIFVDGVDLATVPLTELRRRVTIIPQEPVLFSGTIRFNLDPLGEHADEKLWTALEAANLSEFVLTRSLDHIISENSEMSVGQRQLLCLARAILRRSKLVIMDEATASVDMFTDELIQKTIREEFKGSTLITIAHRVKTVLDYDRVLVLKAGRVVDFDTPQNLMNDESSLFYKIATSAATTTNES